MADIKREMRGSKRRSYLGIGVAKWENNNLGNIAVLCPNNDKLANDCWKLLRRSKKLLAMRTITPELLRRFDYRKEWNLSRPVEKVLDLFPSLKYSYSSLCGRRFDSVSSVNILRKGGNKIQVADIARSHSIRLDPVDAPKELFKYRQRIQKIIEWAYGNELVPVMMTLTLYHRWQPLEPLCRVLRRAWTNLFGNGRAGFSRKQYVGLRGYIRRMEETFNDGCDESATNAGWHPHYHIILLIPRDKLQVLSDYEGTLRTVWVELVRKYYRQEFGEDIPAAYYETFWKHSLVLSRYQSEAHALRCGNATGKAGELLQVHDGKYLAKIMGTDEPLYGGDNELTTLQKCSKFPFDILRGKVTANAADLWCEYALATKKIPCFTFSQGLQAEVDAYFKDSVSDEMTVSLSEKIVAKLKPEDYKWLYQNGYLDELFAVARQGSEAVKVWLSESFGMEVLESPDSAVENISNSVPADNELATSLLSSSDKFYSQAFLYLELSKKVGARNRLYKKRAKQHPIFSAQNKSPPSLYGRNKAPPK